MLFQHDRTDETEAKVVPGAFIPRRPVNNHKNEETPPKLRTLAAALSFVFVWINFSSVEVSRFFAPDSMAASVPMVMVRQEAPYSHAPLTYGSNIALSKPSFFESTKQAFVEAGQSFIEINLENMHLSYYQEGEKSLDAEIISKGQEGTWWETPSGLYQISHKQQTRYIAADTVYHPWSMLFQGNFAIHGEPYKVDGSVVSDQYAGGVRLNNQDAEELFNIAGEEVPVLVYEKDIKTDSFLYEPKVPELGDTKYVVADILSNTVLASSDLDAQVPIASLTKLMTALVAAENIDLNTDVYVSQEKYVTTLVPRLEGRTTVSMYSLLQLLLVESSNEAAEVIASQIGREKFIGLMNEKAKALSLDDTVFTDPSGLDNGNVSTPEDLLRLAQYIYNSRSFIFKLTVDVDLPTVYRSGEFSNLENFNLVEGIDTVIGGKVGETRAAGQTSVTLHQIKVGEVDRIVAIIVLGSDGRHEDVTLLHDYFEERFVQ